MSDVLESRARILVSTTEEAKKPLTMHHLSETADRVLSALSPEDRRAAVLEAQKIANREEPIGPPPGYAKRNGSAPARNKPTPARNAGAPARNGKVAARTIEPSSEADWTPNRLRAFIRGRLQSDPTLTAAALYAEARKLGRVHVTPVSFATGYHGPMRKELGISSSPRPQSKASPRVEMQAALGIGSNDRPAAALAGENGKVAPPPVLENPAPVSTIVAPAPVSVVAPAPEPSPRCSFCGKTRKAVQSMVEGPGVRICSECVRLSSQLIDPPKPVVATRPGIIEFASGGESFKASRRDDGGWDVELRARVDENLMDKLAGVMYQRIVGRAMEASA